MLFTNLRVLLAETGQSPRRIVSLVPSYTESLFDLGLGERVVGVTDFCVHPGKDLVSMTRVGGPKNPSLEVISSLQPDLVLANQEENDESSVRMLAQTGIPVWVSFPKTVNDALAFLFSLSTISPSRQALIKLTLLQDSLELAQKTAGPSLRYFIPIWQGKTGDQQHWYMTFNGDTYPSNLLACFGGINCFENRDRRYPLSADLDGSASAEEAQGRDTRYPCLSVDEIRSAEPQMILIPDDPYTFSDDDIAFMTEALHDTQAVQTGRIYRIDGSLLTWCGSRLGLALQEFPRFFSI